MVQQHLKHNKKGMGKKLGYSVVFSPAHITHTRKRKKGRDTEYYTKGGVAILYKPRLTRLIQPGIDMVGHNGCALVIKLAKNRLLNLVTSYIPHGATHDETRTIVEVNQYLDLFKVPFV